MAKKRYNFQKLTPVNDANISVYDEAINFIFENQDIRNVAISGAYSAGKSSVLESYKAKHSNYRFVHLSLAHFRSSEQKNGEVEDVNKSNQKDVNESILEGKILNQLIHQIPSKNIPQTNFRVKKDVNKKQLLLLTVYFSLFFGSIAFLLLSSKLNLFVKSLSDNWIRGILSACFGPYATILIALICCICSVVFIHLLVTAQKNKNMFRKISLQGNEIEIFEDQDDSYFDKYLNEVLYLFENVGADVIVFEDMDRFNTNQIFERLREVNTLVNTQRKKELGENYTPLRFFFLLRDDIFETKDRAKFFDYILPIVPVVDSSNSYEQLLKLLKEDDMLDKFDQSFLQSLSLYVDDMRILKNIYNEFLIYNYRLNITDLDWNKMMAMIAYKNLFPHDFSDLQLARGFVFSLFEQKPLLAKKAIEANETKRQELRRRIELASKETLTSQEELDDAYAAKVQRLPRPYGFYSQESQAKITEYDAERSKRKKAIDDRVNDNLSILDGELANVEHEITLTQTKSLADLITRENIDEAFAVIHTNEINETNEFKEIKGSDYFDLLKFLIRSGYIDETYTDYMTYFYEGSISANDKTFLRRITDKRGASYTYSLKDPQKVISSPILRDVEFEQEETLNFDLFECLLLNQDNSKYVAYLQTFIVQLRETKNFDFISKFYDTGKAHKQFVINANMQWPEFFSVVLSNNAIPSAQIREYSEDTLCFSDNDTITKVNVNNCLAEYISNSSDYLAVEIDDINKLVSSFQLINITFSSIDYEKSCRSLFDEVYRHNMYTLAFENIALMLKHEYGIEDASDIIHRNFTLVQSKSDAPLARYITENIGEYIEVVLDNCEGNIFDDEDAAIILLNNSDIGCNAKAQYVDYLSAKITDITKIEESDLWPIIMDHDTVGYSVSNFVNYFKKHGMDSALVAYTNNMPADVTFSSVADEFGTDTAEEIFDATVICNDMINERYENILVDLGYIFDSFDADDISDEKFDILIRDNILQMNVESLNFVRGKYESHRFEFIRWNLNEYLILQSKSTFNLVETLEIITWDISDDQKRGLLALTDEPITVVGKQYSDLVSAYIITNNLNEEDQVDLYASYSQYGEKTQNAIGTLAVDRVSDIISDSMEMDNDLLSVLIQSDDVPRSEKISLFTMAIPKLNGDTCKKHFNELGISELNGIFIKAGGRRNYEKSDEVTAILEGLKANGWIYEYHEDERNSSKYVIVKSRPRGKGTEFID